MLKKQLLLSKNVQTVTNLLGYSQEMLMQYAKTVASKIRVANNYVVNFLTVSRSSFISNGLAIKASTPPSSADFEALG